MHSLNVKLNRNLVEKIMHSFEVHSNESVYRKSGCFGWTKSFCSSLPKDYDYEGVTEKNW